MDSEFGSSHITQKISFKLVSEPWDAVVKFSWSANCVITPVCQPCPYCVIILARECVPKVQPKDLRIIPFNCQTSLKTFNISIETNFDPINPPTVH